MEKNKHVRQGSMKNAYSLIFVRMSTVFKNFKLSGTLIIDTLRWLAESGTDCYNQCILVPLDKFKDFIKWMEKKILESVQWHSLFGQMQKKELSNFSRI